MLKLESRKSNGWMKGGNDETIWSVARPYRLRGFDAYTAIAHHALNLLVLFYRKRLTDYSENAYLRFFFKFMLLYRTI